MVAIKEITKFRTDQTEDENEWTLNLLLSDHPNILTPLAQFRTPLAEVIVSELAPGGDLFDRLEGPGGQVSKELCRKYMFEVRVLPSYLWETLSSRAMCPRFDLFPSSHLL